MTTVIVSGASGLLGREVYRIFTACSTWNTVGLTFSRPLEGLRQCDLTDRDQVRDLFASTRPAAFVHCAAERRPDKMQTCQEESWRLNVAATEHLCALAAEQGCLVLYISTDYVFDGRSPPYSEDATPNPLNFYGKSKAAGEEVTLRTSPQNIVLRVPILFGPSANLDESAATILCKCLLDPSAPSSINHLAPRSPTLTTDVARVCQGLIDRGISGKDVKGVYHFAASDVMTRYELVTRVASLFGLDYSHVVPDTKVVTSDTPRPDDCRMTFGRLEKLGLYKYTKFEDAVGSVLGPFFNK